jgi:hypothetical protein
MKHTLTPLAALLLARFVAFPAAAAPGAEPAQHNPPGYMTADQTERYLTEKFQLNAPSRRYNKDAPVHLKTWSEEAKAAQRKAFIEAKAGLDRAVTDKSAAFSFPPGVYRYPGTGITVQGATNLTIHAAGCEFICEPLNDKFEGFVFSRCDTVTLKGPLVLDSEVMPYFQGTVLGFSKPGDGAVEIKAQPMQGYSLRPRHINGDDNRAAVFDPDTGAMINGGQWARFQAEKNADGTVTLRCPKWGGNIEVLAVGRTIAVEGVGTAFDCRGCKNMAIDGVDSFGGGTFGGKGVEGRFTVRNFRLIPRPGTHRLVANQVGQFNYASDLTVEDSEFGMGWDDGICHGGKMRMVYRQVSPNQIMTGLAVSPGSTLRFFRYDDFAPLGSAVVAACEPVKDEKVKADMQADFKAFLDARRRKENWYKSPTLITFTKDFAVPANAVVDEILHDQPCAITVRRTVWYDQAAQAILVNGVKRGTIENNLFIRNAGNGVHICFDYYWAGGPIPNNVAIRGNVFKGNPRNGDGKPGACIFVGAEIADPTKNNAIMSGMTIEDNKIVAPTCGGIILGNVDGGSIRNNVIDFSGSQPPTLPQHYQTGAIVMNTCRNVVVENNHITCATAFPNEILLLGNCDKDSVVVKNNIIASAPPVDRMDSFNSLWALYQPQGRMGWRFQFAPVGSQEMRDMPTPYWWAGQKNETGQGYFAPDRNWGGMIKARAGLNDVVLTFMAPRSGIMRVDCDQILNDGKTPARIAILKNGKNLWPKDGFETVQPQTSSSAHLEVQVTKGDHLPFRVSSGVLFLKPILTYTDSAHVNP